jgi:hypothetical protein
MLFDSKRDPGFRLIALGTGQGLLSPAQQSERLDSLVSDVPPLKGDSGYGLGLTKEHEWIGHGGEMPGYNTSLYFHPQLDAVVAVEVDYESPTEHYPCCSGAVRVVGALSRSG